MKFLKQAVAAALIAFAQAEAKTLTRKEIDARVKAGMVDTKTLLRNAIPYNQVLRRMEDGASYYYDQDGDDWAEGVYGDNQIEDQDYERLEISSSYTLQFNKCLTLETENYNLLLDNLITYAKSGTLTSIRNYALFYVCNGSSNCNKNKNNLYMVDLTTFVEAAIAYGPSEKERMCEICSNFAYICGYDDDDNSNGDDNNRKLSDYSSNYEVFDSDSCSKCQEFGCWYDADGDQEEDYETIAEWVSEVAECKQTDSQWQDLDLYAGLTCNSDGTGIDVGVFIDKNCRMLNKDYSFSSIMGDDDYQYYYQSQDIIPMMFQNKIDCRDTTNVQYVDYDSYTYEVEGGNRRRAENDQYQQSNDANDVCQGIFYGDFAPRPLGNCGETSEGYQYMMNGEEYQYQNQQNDDDQENLYQYTQAQQMLYNTYGESVDWYGYDISAQDVLDGASTCEAVSDKYLNSKRRFNGDGGGFWNGGIWHNGDTALQTPIAALSPLEIAWIVLASASVTALFMHLTRKHLIKRKRKTQKEVHVVGPDDKGQPLIIS